LKDDTKRIIKNEHCAALSTNNYTTKCHAFRTTQVSVENNSFNKTYVKIKHEKQKHQ